MSKFILIDGMSMVFRAYHAMIKSGLKNKKGELTGAIFGFANIITAILEKENPERFAVVFDTSEPTFRDALYTEYKANRAEFPEDLAPQLLKIKELIDLMGIPQIESHGYEADDIIGTLAKESSSKGIEVFCLTADKDFYQLVDDHITIMKPSRKGEDLEIVSYEGVKEKFGVRPDQVIDVQAIIGDSVDNVPGVKGVGEKTAIPLIQKYGSIENLYENIAELPENAMKKKLIENKEMAFLSKILVTIKIDVPLDFTIDNCFLNVAKYQELDKFFDEQGFRTLRQKWQIKANPLGNTIGNNVPLPNEEDKITFDDNENINTSNKTQNAPINNGIYTRYTIIDDLTELNELVNYLSNYESIVINAILDNKDRSLSNFNAICLSVLPDEVYFIELKLENDSTSTIIQSDNLFSFQNGENQVNFIDTNKIEILKPLLENPNIKKVGFNIKNTIYKFKELEINLTPIGFDVQIASFILDADIKHTLDFLVDKYLGKKPEIELPHRKFSRNRFGKEYSETDIKINQLRGNKTYLETCLNTEFILELRKVLEEKLVQENLLELCNDIEFPIVEVLANMEYIGISLDTNLLKQLSIESEIKIKDLTIEIFKETGEEFNIDSPKQLANILFERMRLPIIKKTKTGYSTDSEVLTELAVSYPIADLILDYRQLVKLKSTYIDSLPKLVSPIDNRLHTSYNQLGASTGRLSSNEPNLQNIPIRTTLGKEVRKAFVAEYKNAELFSADYSQIELRIMAYLSNDEYLIQAFKDGKDIHTATAANLFGKSLEDVDSDLRRIAKTVNFGIMYGLGSFGLAQRLKIGRKEAKEIIDNYFDKYKGILNYMQDTIHFVEKNGYAVTLCGRKRYFGDINHKNKMLKTAAERAAINMPIQGTASDMMKIAMNNIYKNFIKYNFKSKMLLQVHDELVFEVFEDEKIAINDMVIETMQNALKLGDVPILVESGFGHNWLIAH